MRRDLVLVVMAGLWPQLAVPSAASGTSDRGPGSRSTAGVECIVFDDQAEFEDFNEADGKVLKGIEDFEECILPPNAVTAFDDSLCGGIPNSPDGFPFPNGLDQLNLCVQANLNHSPEAPNPRGISGLRAFSTGYLGATSDGVSSGTFVDSFDVIFSKLNHTGVGFAPITFLGGSTVEVRVYGKNEDLLATGTAPADLGGSTFFGVWCAEAIGRINVFDPGNGAEGGDNIEMWSIPECGDGARAGETCETCPQDCGPCPFCGDGEVNQPSEECDPPGFPSTCPNSEACLPDCTCGDVCGDEFCSGDEDECSCPQDCGPCPFCGDGEVNQPSEECDPPGFPSACPNNEACLPDCTCGDVCGDELCSGDEDECTCPQDCLDECPCIFFFDPAEFEAFNEQDGLILKGIETFEESVLPPATADRFDGPLCSGVPNAPDAFPFPNGLDESNLCVQSNNLGGDPTMPSPSGANGLAAVSAGFLGAISDIVVASTFVHSCDMIFSEPNHMAIGFDTISILGSGTVEIRVYDEHEILLVMGAAPVDPAGSNFFGVWCNLPISRVNVFDTGDDAEGADNIQMWVEGDPCGECPTDVDDSGDTGAFDLAFLLGLWGPCAPGGSCACLDADADGLLGLADLAVLLGSWGPCE